MLLPSTCCHWKQNFESVIPYLEKDYYVVCVSYDGFDKTEDSIFPDMITETEKIEQYIKDNFKGNIHAHDLQHEELLILYPEKWAEEVKAALSF